LHLEAPDWEAATTEQPDETFHDQISVCQRHHGGLASGNRPFIAALNNDPELKGKITYRCMKNRDDASYYHLAAAADEQAIKTLQQRDFFKHYTEKTRQVAGGEVVVTPIELIAETA